MHDVFFERDLSIYSSPCLLRSLSRGDLRSDFLIFIQCDHLSYMIRRLFNVILLYLTPFHMLIEWIVLVVGSYYTWNLLSSSSISFWIFDTRPHHNVQIVNFYTWHLLFVDFFDLRTSQLLIFKYVDWKYRQVVISWDPVVPLSWIRKSRDCSNPSSFFHFSFYHFQTSCSDMSVRIWCLVRQEHPAADHLNAVMSAVLRDKVCWASDWHRRGPMAKPVLPSRGGVRHLSECVKLSTVESLESADALLLLQRGRCAPALRQFCATQPFSSKTWRGKTNFWTSAKSCAYKRQILGWTQFFVELRRSVCTSLETDALTEHLRLDLQEISASVLRQCFIWDQKKLWFRMSMTAEWSDRDRDRRNLKERWTSLLRWLSPKNTHYDCTAIDRMFTPMLSPQWMSRCRIKAAHGHIVWKACGIMLPSRVNSRSPSADDCTPALDSCFDIWTPQVQGSSRQPPPGDALGWVCRLADWPSTNASCERLLVVHETQWWEILLLRITTLRFPSCWFDGTCGDDWWCQMRSHSDTDRPDTARVLVVKKKRALFKSPDSFLKRPTKAKNETHRTKSDAKKLCIKRIRRSPMPKSVKRKKSWNVSASRLMHLWTPFQERLVLHIVKNKDEKVVKDGAADLLRQQWVKSLRAQACGRDPRSTTPRRVLEAVRLLGSGSSREKKRILLASYHKRLLLHQVQMACPTLRGSAVESVASRSWRIWNCSCAEATRSGWNLRSNTEFSPRG